MTNNQFPGRSGILVRSNYRAGTTSTSSICILFGMFGKVSIISMVQKTKDKAYYQVTSPMSECNVINWLNPYLRSTSNNNNQHAGLATKQMV